jgi:hypothetical protein
VEQLNSLDQRLLEVEVILKKAAAVEVAGVEALHHQQKLKRLKSLILLNVIKKLMISLMILKMQRMMLLELPIVYMVKIV